LWRQFSILVNA